jgi:hypothetical protein
VKRVLLSLWLIGGVLYLVSTLLLTNAVDLFNRDDPKPIASDATPASSPSPEASGAAVVQSTPEHAKQHSALNPPTADSPHAISPDLEIPSVESASSTQEQSPVTGEPKEAASNPGPEEELLKVASAASIRNGPSASADIIGTAYAGAKVRVASRDAGWTQIIDPSSGNRGWIDSTVLAPLTSTVDTASTEDVEQGISA